MKEFFKMMFASMLGVFLATLIMFFISAFFIIGLAVQVNSESKVSMSANAEESVYKIVLEGAIYETVEENPFSMFIAEQKALSLNDILTSIENAKELKTIKGIYLEIRHFDASTANVDVIRRALKDFKESGKFIVAYADHYTQGGYYLSSIADEVYLNPQGILLLTGFASQTMFYKGLLEKVGVEMMVFKVGTYKGAVEPYITDKLSDANREQITSYQQTIWGNIVEDIAESRNISVEDIDSYANKGFFFSDPSIAVECGLIDELKYRNEVEGLLIQKAEQNGKSLKAVHLSKMKKMKKQTREYRNKIAVIYAEGEITQSVGLTPYEMSQKNITEKFADELKKLQTDENINAVVIRVNSPGGSAYISEQIWKQVVELKKTKPVVVSMGGVAASGGYYISAGANKIVAEANTITGSIGVFGIFPNAANLYKKIDLTTDVVKTHNYADIGDISRPMTSDEKLLMQGFVERTYDLFLTRCADGRNMTKEAIDSIGQGRVWTGEQALKIGLIDEIGGLDEAITLAADLANIYNYNVITVSTAKDFLKEFFEKQLEEVKMSAVKDVMGDDYEYFKILKQIRSTQGIQARIPYDLKPL